MIYLFIFRRKRLWVHPILQERERAVKGHLTLLNDLLMRDDEEKFLNFVRLTKAECVELLSLVRPLIIKKNTNFRKAISRTEACFDFDTEIFEYWHVYGSSPLWIPCWPLNSFTDIIWYTEGNIQSFESHASARAPIRYIKNWLWHF